MLKAARDATSQLELLGVTVLTSQSGAWGSIKKSLRRPRGKAKVPVIPSPSPDDEEIIQPSPPTKIPEPEPVAIEEDDLIEIEDLSQPIVEVIPIPKQVNPVALVALESRMPEIEAACRDFLALGNLDDSEDFKTYIKNNKIYIFYKTEELSQNYIATIICFYFNNN